MLSVIEKPSPPDPQCPNLTHHHHHHHHRHVDHHDHQTSTSNSHHLDLPNSHLSDFSIRDYVFTSRSKDIKTNWPFSLKNLELCRKHGVKDLLPPFQPLDAIRNQVRRRFTVDDPQSIRTDIINGDHASRLVDDDDHAVLLDSLNSNTQVKANIKLPLVCFDTTTTSVCQSEIEESVPTNKSSTSPSLEAASVEAEPEPSGHCTVALAHKAQSTTRGPGKNKCKLIVKFSFHSAQDTSNSTTQSEAMASKICPVCKTFSSSSNTTLNAHIDQCLSVESSTPKWTVDSKLSTRHRIKPRKTRLMVDVYATALPCTLEDLDRRNGSNWASGALNFPTPDPESDKSEEIAQRVSSCPLDDHASCDNAGAVYIDSNGIKLRILDTPPVSKMIEHLRPRKLFKGAKFLSARKKNRRASRCSLYLKLAQMKKARSSQVSGGQGKKYVAEGSYVVKGCNTQKLVNPSNSGNLRQWSCSKRTGGAKKLSYEVHLKHNWNISSKNLRIHSSSLGQNREDALRDLSGMPVSLPENVDGSENVFYEAHVNHMVEQSCRINEAGSSLSVASVHGDVERSLIPVKRNARQLRKERTSREGYRTLKPCKSAVISTPVPAPVDNYDLRPSVCAKKPRSCHVFRTKAMKALVRKDVLSRRRTPVIESKSDFADKCSDLKKSNVRWRTDEEIVSWDSEAVRPYDLEHNLYSYHQSAIEDSPSRNTGLNASQNAGVLGVSGRKETVVSEGSQLPFRYSPHGHGVQNIDSSVLDKVDGGFVHGDYQCIIDGINVSQLSTKVAVGERENSHRSLVSEMSKLGPYSKIQSNSLQYKGPLCDGQVISGSRGPSFVGGQEIFHGVQLGSDMLVQNVNMGEYLNSDVVHGSSFSDVDPIPIPGPPGSFLPSPRRMGSEDFQGNSSVTTSRVQSSQDQQDFIDGDLSDSPVSATTTVSNSTASRHDLKLTRPLPSAVAHASREKIRSSFSGASIDSSLENAAVVVRSTDDMAAERLTLNKEKFSVSKIPLGFKTDNKPCCCQRKESATPDHVILNFQESQLLKRRAMGSRNLSHMERQTSCNLNTMPNTVEASSDHMFSRSDCPTVNSEKVVPPGFKAPPANQNGRTDAGVKFPGRNDCDSMSTSSSNSILRLMGKNLMVVNRDQDESMQAGQTEPQSQINHPTSSLFPMFSSVSGIQQQREIYHSFHPNFHRGSVNLCRDPHNSVEGQHVVAIRTHTSSPRTSQMLYRGAGYVFPDQHMDGGFATREPCEYKADYSLATLDKGSKKRPIGAPMEHLDRAITIPDHQRRNALSAVKEIITIDDAPESEEYLTRDGAKYDGFCAATPFYGRQSPPGKQMEPWTDLVSQFVATPSSSRGHLRSAQYKCQSGLF